MTAAWRNRIVGYGEVPPGDLVANEKNWRRHPKAQAAAMRGVLRQVGIVQNIIVNRTTGNMLDGHLRVELAVEDQQPAVPVTYVEVSEAEEMAILASFDPLGDLAVADPEAFGEVMAIAQIDSPELKTFLDSMLEDAQMTGLTEDSGDGASGEEADGRDRMRTDEKIVKAVFSVDELAAVERAIRATGEIDRGAAVAAICRAYLEAKGESL